MSLVYNIATKIKNTKDSIEEKNKYREQTLHKFQKWGEESTDKIVLTCESINYNSAPDWRDKRRKQTSEAPKSMHAINQIYKLHLVMEQ